MEILPEPPGDIIGKPLGTILDGTVIVLTLEELPYHQIKYKNSMKQNSLQGTENIACALELTLIETKEQLEIKNQKVKELHSTLRDKENEIAFLKEILSARKHLFIISKIQ